MCHAFPTICFNMDRRGFIREGYYADLVLINSGEFEVNKIIYITNVVGLHLKEENLGIVFHIHLLTET